MHLVAPTSCTSLLDLRGGETASQAALLSISVNTIALTLHSAIRRPLLDLRIYTKMQVLGLDAVTGFVAFMLTYFLCGFVPMGFVVGSKPWIGSMHIDEHKLPLSA